MTYGGGYGGPNDPFGGAGSSGFSPGPSAPQPFSGGYGPQNYGPQNYGPNGPQNYGQGPQNYGQPNGPQNFGPQNYGPQNFGPQNYGPQNYGPQGEVETLATLSVVFAFVFSPVGAVLGHLALSRIKQLGLPGRQRAIVGLTLSYMFIVLGIVALVAWFAIVDDSHSTTTASTSATATRTSTPTATSTPRTTTRPPRTTVILPPPPGRQPLAPEDIRAGQCLELVNLPPDPTTGKVLMNVFDTPCAVRDGVMQVTQVLSTDSCPGRDIHNTARTIFACLTDYKG